MIIITQCVIHPVVLVVVWCYLCSVYSELCSALIDSFQQFVVGSLAAVSVLAPDGSKW